MEEYAEEMPAVEEDATAEQLATEEKEMLELKQKIKAIMRKNPSLSMDPIDRFGASLDVFTLEQLKTVQENLEAEVVIGAPLSAVEEGLIRSYSAGIKMATGIDITAPLLCDKEFKIALRESTGGALSGIPPWATLILRSAMIMARHWDQIFIPEKSLPLLTSPKPNGNARDGTPSSQPPLPSDG